MIVTVKSVLESFVIAFQTYLANILEELKKALRVYLLCLLFLCVDRPYLGNKLFGTMATHRLLLWGLWGLGLHMGAAGTYRADFLLSV